MDDFPPEEHEVPPSVKKPRFGFMETLVQSQQSESVDEIAVLRRVCPTESSEDSVFSFWNVNKQMMPTLHKMALHYLTLPASSASVERLFSVAGYISRARRASLKPATIRQLVFAREYLRKK